MRNVSIWKTNVIFGFLVSEVPRIWHFMVLLRLLMYFLKLSKSHEYLMRNVSIWKTNVIFEFLVSKIPRIRNSMALRCLLMCFLNTAIICHYFMNVLCKISQCYVKSNDIIEFAGSKLLYIHIFINIILIYQRKQQSFVHLSHIVTSCQF